MTDNNVSDGPDSGARDVDVSVDLTRDIIQPSGECKRGLDDIFVCASLQRLGDIAPYFKFDIVNPHVTKNWLSV